MTKNHLKWVNNISSHHTLSEVKLLKRGANFSVTPPKLPIDDFIVAAEEAGKRLDPGSAAAMKAEIVDIIKKENTKKRYSNITKEEREVIKELRNRKEITIVPADKGRCIVVMDRLEYVKKMEEKLSDKATYKEIYTQNSNPDHQ